MDFDHHTRHARTSGAAAADNASEPGKRTLTEQLPVQRREAAGSRSPDAAASETSASVPSVVPPNVTPRATLQMLFGLPSAAAEDPTDVHAAAARGTATPTTTLPYADHIQRAFGRHDISGIQAHMGSQAAASTREMGAQAYATGDHVVLGEGADMHTVAHEAAHVLQQRGGVQLKGGVGETGDEYERHADEVANLTARGASAEALLDRYAGAGAAAAPAVQRRVNPGAAPQTKVTVIASGAPGVIQAEVPHTGYDVIHPNGRGNFGYNALNPRVSAWVNTVIPYFADVEALDQAGWNFVQYPQNRFQLTGNQVIAQSPVSRGDMHDIRAALVMCQDLKVLIAFPAHGQQTYQADVNTILGYYQGVPNIAQRVAVVGIAANQLRADVEGQEAGASTKILRWYHDEYLEHDPQHGQQTFATDLRHATTGDEHGEDEFDCTVDLVQHGFYRNAPYVLVNYRDSGHNPGQGRPPSHPEHDSGAQGFWDLVRCVIAAGYEPVPMGNAPGLGNWPGPSLVDYFRWPSTAANQRRNKRQAEYYLLAALKRFNPNVRALAWRSGVTDAISFAGIPVLALDVPGSVGEVRAQRREEMLPGHYQQVMLSDRVDAEQGHVQMGVAGWLGPLAQEDFGVVLGALGAGPHLGRVHDLTQTTQGQETIEDVVRRFVANLARLAGNSPPDRLFRAFGQLPPQTRAELARAMPHAELLAMRDLVHLVRTYVGQQGGVPAQAPAQIGAPLGSVVAIRPTFARQTDDLVAPFRPLLTVLADLDQLFAALQQGVLQDMVQGFGNGH